MTLFGYMMRHAVAQVVFAIKFLFTDFSPPVTCKGCGWPEGKPLKAKAISCCPECTIKHTWEEVF